MMKKNNWIKFAILAALLIVPGVIFLFMKIAGENYYDLPVFNPEVPGCSLNQQESTHRVPPFILTDQDSSQFSSEKLSGEIYVTAFFSLNCTNNCQQRIIEMRRVQSALAATDLKLVGITTNPAQDGPFQLKQYAYDRELEGEMWHLLTGDAAVIEELARCGYFSLGEEAAAYSSPNSYGTHLVLVDGKGQIRGFYEAENREEIDRLIIEIQVLQYQKRLN